jgi:hypothetical protein
VTLCSLVQIYQRLGGICCFHIQDRRVSKLGEGNRVEIQDRKCARDVTLRRVRVTSIAAEK